MDAYSAAWTMGKIFDKLNIDYCIGGSIACNFYRETRSTKDVDINVYARNVRKSEWMKQV